MAFDANDLSPHEHFVMERARAGEIADFTPMAGPDGGKPAVRAGFLRKLMLGLDPVWAVRPPGVRIKGARIEGAVDLTDCSGAGGAGMAALSLEACDIPDLIDLTRARLVRFSLNGCRLHRLTALNATIDGELSLAGAQPFGTPGKEALSADLSGACIGGALDCRSAHLYNGAESPKGAALSARGARIGGDVRLGEKLKAEGVVDLSGAEIGGDLDLTLGSFRNEHGSAVLMTNTRIAGQLLGDAKIHGPVSLQCAEIARNLDFRGADIANPKSARADSFGVAIDAASLSVGGAALFQGANIKGEVLLADARIGGYLAFGGGRFMNGGGWAIRAPNVRVGGNLTLKIEDGGFAPLGNKTVIEGGAKFDRAQVGGALSWLNLELRGPGPDNVKGGVFSFADANITGPVQARGLATHQQALIDASGARCAALDDDLKAGWGAENARLNLEGFDYGRIESQDQRWRQRLAWLRRASGRFSPQPYTHVANVYARAGRREDARRILLAQHDQRTLLASAGPITWLLSSLFGVIAGYGLSPIRIARALVLFVALGVAGVFAMNGQGALVTPDGRQCAGAVEPALYAIDVALPVIDLGQESRCAPGRTARAELSPGMEVSPYSDWRVFEGVAIWRWAHALYALLGAILTALAIVTFSGVLKPREN
ncbi:MAG TPA: hypothetical protein VEF55_03295 [Candidatus Binatia bacterium]|nr:hypothetical protein [Candidatus Binatia bacterium]